jgi:hypothetical protein
MAPTNQANTNQLIGNAEATGNQLQNQYNTQSAQTQQQYGQTYNQANQAYQNLQNYNQQLPQQYMQNANQIAQGAGYNQQTLQNSMNNATALSETMANLPQATNQMGNYSGATAGQVAGNYARMAPNIATAQAGANTALANQQAAYQIGQTGAQNITSQQSGNYQALYSQANAQMQTAAQTMAQIEQLQQQQGGVTAQQVAAYQGAFNGYIQAQAAAEGARTQMISAQATASQTNQQVAMANAMSQELQKIYGPNWAQAAAYLNKGQQPPTSLLSGGNQSIISILGGPSGGNLQGGGINIQ